MGRKRATDKHLPLRVQRNHGAFYYLRPVRRPDGTATVQWIHLGRTEADMWVAWRAIEAEQPAISTVGDLIDAYMREIVPTLKTYTARDHTIACKGLRAAFAALPVTAVKPMHCYQYLAARGRKAPVRANRELAAFSRVMRYAIRLGLRDDNPTIKVERLREQPRERLPETWEIAELLEHAGELLRAYVPLKVLIGLRQGDMLALRKEQITADGILVREGKTGKRRLIEWSHELRLAVAAAQAIKRPVSSLYLFATREGQRYTGDGFRSIWHRAMRRALDAGRLVESFTEHDLRATSATEAGERAQELLDHSSARTTAIYKRNKEPRRIKPLR